MTRSGGAIQVSRCAGCTRILLCGQLDCMVDGHVADLVVQLRESPQLVCIDASQLRFIDARGLGALVRLVIHAARPPALLRPPPILRFLLDVTRLWHLFEACAPQGDLAAAARNGLPEYAAAAAMRDGVR